MSLKDAIFRWYTEWRTPARGPSATPSASADLAKLTVALVTTAGVRLAAQTPFDTQHGDPTGRRIPGDVDPAGLVVDHTHFDTGPARADLDCIFPLRTLRRLVADSVVGGVSPVHFGLMGYIPDTAPLVRETAPAIVQELLAARVGAVLLSPG